MKGIIIGVIIASAALVLVGKPAPHVPQGIVSDWTDQHVRYPDSNDRFMMARIRRDPRWGQNWYHRHPEAWWPERHRGRGNGGQGSRRDWNMSLAASPLTSGFEPLFDFTFAIGPDTGYGSLNTTDPGVTTIDPGEGKFLATAGTLTVTSSHDGGTYSLFPGGPAQQTSPSGVFLYDNLLYPSIDPGINNNGPLFAGNGLEINIFSNGPDSYQFYDSTRYNNVGGTFNLYEAPGGGQTFPAKFVFDVTAAPSCTNDFMVIGIPASPVAGGQANIVGVNNLYTTPAATGYCAGTGPTVTFAYASGPGQVPGSVVISQNGKQIAYVTNLPTGSSYFHVLTLGTTSHEGASPTAAVAPGTGGSNAVDQRVLLSPDGGTTNQSSTNAPFVAYTPNDASDVAYVTTYSRAGNGSGYLYKFSNVFNGVTAPTLVWSVPINAVPSTPVYDWVSNNIFFTDSNGRIDYVTDTGASPPVVYGAVLANGTTSVNPVIVDGTNQMVYATFNSNGTNALVVQAPTNLASTVSVPVGPPGASYTAPYGVDFNNDWYTGSGTPLMYVAGTSTGTVPTLYRVGFDASGLLNPGDTTTAALATGMADSSPLTEFYSASLLKDYLFVGVTDACVATIGGGSAGCVMRLDITGGFPIVDASTTALAAAGGTSGIIVDNDSNLAQASSIYYATKTGANLVKATQSGLN